MDILTLYNIKGYIANYMDTNNLTDGQYNVLMDVSDYLYDMIMSEDKMIDDMYNEEMRIPND